MQLRRGQGSKPCVSGLTRRGRIAERVRLYDADASVDEGKIQRVVAREDAFGGDSVDDSLPAFDERGREEVTRFDVPRERGRPLSVESGFSSGNFVVVDRGEAHFPASGAER